MQNHSDALVFFGATGDLAYKKIFPALQNLIQHGHLDVPVIGVAKAGWKLDSCRHGRATVLSKHGGIDEAAFAKLSICCGTSMAITTIRRRSPNCARRWTARHALCTTWRFRPAFSPQSSNTWPSPAAPTTRAS